MRMWLREWAMALGVALAVGLGPSCQPGLALTLAESVGPGDRLGVLDSFLGEWEGRVKGSEGTSPIFRARYTRMLDGAAVLYELKVEPSPGIDLNNLILKYAHHAIIFWDAGVNSPRSRGVNTNGDAWDAVWTLSEPGNAGTSAGRVWTIESTILDAEGHTSAMTILKTCDGPDRFVETLQPRSEPNNPTPGPDLIIEFVRVKPAAK